MRSIFTQDAPQYAFVLHKIIALFVLLDLNFRDDVLQLLALPALQVMGQGAVLQDDTTCPHRAHVDDFLQQHIIRMD